MCMSVCYGVCGTQSGKSVTFSRFISPSTLALSPPYQDVRAVQSEMQALTRLNLLGLGADGLISGRFKPYSGY